MHADATMVTVMMRLYGLVFVPISYASYLLLSMSMLRALAVYSTTA